MTSAMWGIVVGLGVIFGVSFYRYAHQPAMEEARFKSVGEDIQRRKRGQ
jgi:hypothetical protein